MIFPRRLYDEVCDHALSESPRECCGVVAARDGVATRVFRAANVAPDPESGFEIDAEEHGLIRRVIASRGWDFAAVYHSHPGGWAYPSVTDRRFAFYPELLMVVVGMDGPVPEPRAFWVRDGRPVDAPLTVVG